MSRKLSHAHIDAGESFQFWTATTAARVAALIPLQSTARPAFMAPRTVERSLHGCARSLFAAVSGVASENGEALQESGGKTRLRINCAFGCAFTGLGIQKDPADRSLVQGFKQRPARPMMHGTATTHACDPVYTRGTSMAFSKSGNLFPADRRERLDVLRSALDF